MIKRYQQKMITAVQYTYPAPAEVREWMGAAFGNERKARCMNAKGELEILGPDGSIAYMAVEGDYILHGARADGGFTRCNPVVFFQCYEEAIA